MDRSGVTEIIICTDAVVGAGVAVRTRFSCEAGTDATSVRVTRPSGALIVVGTSQRVACYTDTILTRLYTITDIGVDVASCAIGHDRSNTSINIFIAQTKGACSVQG